MAAYEAYKAKNGVVLPPENYEMFVHWRHVRPRRVCAAVADWPPRARPLPPMAARLRQQDAGRQPLDPRRSFPLPPCETHAFQKSAQISGCWSGTIGVDSCRSGFRKRKRDRCHLRLRPRL